MSTTCPTCTVIYDSRYRAATCPGHPKLKHPIVSVERDSLARIVLEDERRAGRERMKR